MTTPRFLQIHTLHSHPAALLNRDDSGFAKRMPFGNAVRTRISSQCPKRSWRTTQDRFALGSIPGVREAVRSRNIIERMVMQPLRDDGNFQKEVLDAVEEEFNKGVYGEKGTTQEGRQPLLLGLPEVEYLREKAAEICRENPTEAAKAGAATARLFNGRGGEGNNFQEFRTSAQLPGGIEGAMFGRMVTSDLAANIQSSIHVAHALTIHQEESESDYFSVVDDLQREDEDAGAAHLGEGELTAGIFYGYVVVDVPTLVSNLEGCREDQWLEADRELAARVIEHLTHIIATVTPGAKLGSTAPYTYADLALIEAGDSQPRSLANAYRDPCDPRLAEAVQAMSRHLQAMDRCYETGEIRRFISTQEHGIEGAGETSLNGLAEWAAEVIRRGEAV